MLVNFYEKFLIQKSKRKGTGNSFARPDVMSGETIEGYTETLSLDSR